MTEFFTSSHFRRRSTMTTMMKKFSLLTPPKRLLPPSYLSAYSRLRLAMINIASTVETLLLDPPMMLLRSIGSVITRPFNWCFTSH
jgi:hypothetical protein